MHIHDCSCTCNMCTLMFFNCPHVTTLLTDISFTSIICDMPVPVTVHSCIDGYSRKILWLRCSFSNHRPGIIASYFLDCVAVVGGFPATLRTDCGTENVMIAAIQSLVSGHHAYGTSPGNQRIEAWWSFYRRQHSNTD